jgi:hypothetical protein
MKSLLELLHLEPIFYKKNLVSVGDSFSRDGLKWLITRIASDRVYYTSVNSNTKYSLPRDEFIADFLCEDHGKKHEINSR